MILKNKTVTSAHDPKTSAGQKQELDVAFYLRRAFKDSKDVYVINDFKFTHNGETAQIDHLVVYTYGFILIESKSITGEVSVNKLGEWSRSYNNKWYGIPSPIKQVELQQKLLREMLFENRASIIGKAIGVVQKTFGLRDWNSICSVSSSAIINRESISEDVSRQLVKTEFLVSELEKVMDMKGSLYKFFTDTRPSFTEDELKSIGSFLLSKSECRGKEKSVVKEILEPVAKANISPQPEVVADGKGLQCKSCGEKEDFQPRYGRYGYYIVCHICGVNTPMKKPCPKCGNAHTKVSKRGDAYTLACSECKSSVRLV
jgi:hypothetical protein